MYGEWIGKRYKQGINVKRAVFSPALCQDCDPGRLVKYLELEVVVLVENASSDGRFLRKAIEHLRPELGRLFADPRVIDIRQAGGIGELMKEAERCMAFRSALVPAGAPSRVIAVADSDAPKPAALSSAAKSLVGNGEKKGYGVHVLAKRAIENYVPDEALAEYRRIRPHAGKAIDLVLGLDDVARDHYPMKTGLDESAAKTGLYPDDVLLHAAVGDFIVDLLTECPQALDQASLCARDHGQDLLALIELLEANT